MPGSEEHEPFNKAWMQAYVRALLAVKDYSDAVEAEEQAPPTHLSFGSLVGKADARRALSRSEVQAMAVRLRAAISELELGGVHEIAPGGRVVRQERGDYLLIDFAEPRRGRFGDLGEIVDDALYYEARGSLPPFGERVHRTR